MEIVKIAQYVDYDAVGPHETVQVLLAGHPGSDHAALRASLHAVRLAAMDLVSIHVSQVRVPEAVSLHTLALRHEAPECRAHGTDDDDDDVD